MRRVGVGRGIALGLIGGMGSGVSGSFSPLSLSNLALWLRADSLALSNGALVTTWSDESPNNNDATQSDSAKKPTYLTGLQNGLPGVRFDGDGPGSNGDFLMLAANLTCGPFTLLMVTKMTDSGNNRGPWLGQDTSLNVLTNDDNRYGLDSGGLIANSAPLSNTIVEIHADTDDWEVVENGVSCGTDSGTFGTTANRIGIGFLSRVFQGDILEMVFYSDRKSSGDRTLVRNYLNSKYAIY